MLKNNNMAVIDRMAGKNLKSSRRRSLSMILSVFLSSFLLFSIFTTGITWFQMERLRNIRLDGAEFDAILYGVTEEQMEACRKNPDIKRTGIAAVSGYIAKTEKEHLPDVGLLWTNESFWNDMMAPARKWVKGRYPEEENEVMATKQALKECGFGDLDVGDTFTAVYGIQDKKFEKTFRISGMWDGYGPKKVFYVSENFYQKTGLTVEDTSSGRYYMDFKQNLISSKKQNAFISSMKLKKVQRLFFTGDFAFSMRILAGIAGLVFVTCLCAYLLIYNIMYLYVAGNVRYYGLLQTIGMTGAQIRRLMYRQILLICGIGTAGGLLSGGLISLILIPVIIKSLGSGKADEITVTLHPAVFLLTVLLSGITVLIAGKKPAETAIAYSPVQALGYRPQAAKTAARAKIPDSRQRKGSLIWSMAKRQITKDRKKSALVMLSLAAPLSVFLCMTTLLTSQGAREFVSSDRNLDMNIKNDTLKQEKKEDRVNIFDQKLLKTLENMDSIKEVNTVIYTEITVPWEPDFADLWMRKFYETWMTIPYEDDLAEYKEHPENFGSSLVGISPSDFQSLNSSLETPIDEDAFLSGKTCILYRNTLALKDSDISGKTITCAEYGNPEHTRSFQISGLTDTNDYTALLGFPPTIIVSDTVVKEFVKDPVICSLGVTYTKEYNEKAETDLLAVLNQQTTDYSYDSKIELLKNVKEAQGNLPVVSAGIVLILALIGITNYINTFMGSIHSRTIELSILESIGMTGRQIKQMLITEGLLYAAGALPITGTAGTAVTWLLYQSMNYMKAGFHVPAAPVPGSVLAILLICAFIPAAAYRQIEKQGTVTERIK